MNAPLDDETLRAAYAARERARAERAASGPSADAVTVEQLLALVEGRGSEAERLATLDRVMASPELRAEYDVLRAAWKATEASNARANASSANAWRWRAAAGALLVVGVGGWLTLANRASRGDDVMRGRVEASSPLVATVTAGDSLRLTWNATRDARDYRVELLDDAGEVVAGRQGTDTTATWSRPAVARARRAWVRTTRVDGSVQTSPAIALPSPVAPTR
jgi:hypothetical protein